MHFNGVVELSLKAVNTFQMSGYIKSAHIASLLFISMKYHLVFNHYTTIYTSQLFSSIMTKCSFKFLTNTSGIIS